MLYTIALILVILWLLGMVTSYTIGGLIHILLVLAIIAVLIRLIQGAARFEDHGTCLKRLALLLTRKTPVAQLFGLWLMYTFLGESRHRHAAELLRPAKPSHPVPHALSLLRCVPR